MKENICSSENIKKFASGVLIALHFHYAVLLLVVGSVGQSNTTTHDVVNNYM